MKFFYPTSDDFFPNFPRECVRVSMTVNRNKIRIVVAGADDFSLEKEYEETPAKLAELKNLLEYKLPNPLTKEWLLAQGFQHG